MPAELLLPPGNVNHQRPSFPGCQCDLRPTKQAKLAKGAPHDTIVLLVARPDALINPKHIHLQLTLW